MNDDIPVLNTIGDKLVSAIAGGGRRRPIFVVAAVAVVAATFLVVTLLVASAGSSPSHRVAVHGPLAASSSGTTTLAGGVAPASNSSSTTTTLNDKSPGIAPPSRPANPPSSRPTVTTPTTILVTPTTGLAPRIPAPATTSTSSAPRTTGLVTVTANDGGQTFSVSVGETIDVELVNANGDEYGEPGLVNTTDLRQTGGSRDANGASGQFVAVAPGTADITSSVQPVCTKVCPMYVILWSVTIDIIG